MPAKKKPVINRINNNSKALMFEIAIPRLQIAANNAQLQKTRDGENRSAILRMANTNVPVMKPN